MTKWVKTVFLSLSFLISSAHANQAYDCQKAPLLLKETVTVCGQLAEIVPQPQLERIMLNLEKPYPQEAMAFEIPKAHQDDFQKRYPDLRSLIGQRICAHGRVMEKHGHLRMQISELVSSAQPVKTLP